MQLINHSAKVFQNTEMQGLLAEAALAACATAHPLAPARALEFARVYAEITGPEVYDHQPTTHNIHKILV